jgi:L-ribulokinase
VMDKALPCGKKLGENYALQHPQDYLDVLSTTIPDVIKQAKITAEEIIGVGVDFTACTVLPVKTDGTPLCFLEEYKEEPHAYVKLWKHHAAQKYADQMNKIAFERKEEFLKDYGGKLSSEWLFPKICEVACEAPYLYKQADKFMEACDWIVWQMTNVETRNSCAAGYKATWNKKRGFPSNDFLKEVNPLLEHVVDDKLSRTITPVGSKAGELTKRAALLTGLKEGTTVTVGNIDGHAAVPAVGVTDANKMMMIIGTSSCHMLLSKEEKRIPGICGVVQDGILPEYYGYEAGQCCVGDHFDWFVKNCVPEQYRLDAKAKGVGIHSYLREKAKALAVGESGLVALDWWNGNRSVLVDADLTGMIVGMNLGTKPEEIYRALIEATAFGTRMIIENYENGGLSVDEMYACGGIARKDDLLMQIYADVTKRVIKVSASDQTAALGSAMFGAVAAGYFKSFKEASDKLVKLEEKSYQPNLADAKIYDELFYEYQILHDYFGRGGNDVMKRLKAIKTKAASV